MTFVAPSDAPGLPVVVEQLYTYLYTNKKLKLKSAVAFEGKVAETNLEQKGQAKKNKIKNDPGFCANLPKPPVLVA